MIDEELYRIAQDELNSDQREADVWNRACALARNDHDEARFLYTNLRVEQLLEDHANGKPLPKITPKSDLGGENQINSSVSSHSLDTATATSDLSEVIRQAVPDDLTAELIGEFGQHSDLAATADHSAAIASMMAEAEVGSANDINAPESEELIPAAQDLHSAGATTAGSGIDDDVTMKLTPELLSELVPNAGPELISTLIPEDELDLASVKIPSDDEITTTPMEPVTSDARLIDTPSESIDDLSTADRPIFADATVKLDALEDDDLAFLDVPTVGADDPQTTPATSVLQSQDARTEDLERQAETWLPGGDDTARMVADPISDADADDTLDSTLPASAIAGAAALAASSYSANTARAENAAPASYNADDEAPAHSSYAASNAAAPEQNQATITSDASTAVVVRDEAPIGTDYQVSGGAINDFSTPNRPSLDKTELLSGRGRLYRVFSRGPGDSRAVKRGVSWVAMFFTLPWLLAKRMVGTALVYTVLWLCVALGVIVTGVVWLDAAPDAAPMLSLWFWGFIALAVVGLIIAPFFLANRWHAASLNGRGYEEVATVRAKNPQRAVKRVVELAA